MSPLLVFKLLLCIGITCGLQGSKPPPDEIPPQIVHHPSDVVVKVGSPATLSCRASGTPEPTIEWLHNGQPLDMNRQDDPSRPITLHEGSLFFLSVVPARRGQSHEGVYSCVARNSAGKVTSRNASLHIAALREEFRVQPSDVEVAVDEVAIMNCSPPIGQPEPNVIWKKDGVLINSTDDHYTVLNGKLIIGPAQKNDSGVYICVASNTMGVRESQAARLSVLVKPVLVRTPQDVSVKVGEAAHFFCEAEGDPMPSVEWSREQGPLPNGRYLVNPDKSLQIHYVTDQDSGKYTCTAVNEVGVSTATAVLHVEDALNTRQKELHKELSALRAELQTVAVMTPSSNMSLVQWKLQSLPTQPHYLDGCEVLYRSLLPASSDWAAKKVPLPSLQTEVGPLKRGYKYEFKVRPYGSNLYGRESNTRHLRVPEIAPGAPPQGLSVTMPVDRNDTVLFSWGPPPHDTHNGIIQGYQVWCVQSDGQPFFNWTLDSGTHSLEIGMLHPGRQYWVRVAAVNGAGVGVKSDPHRLLIENNQRVSHALPASGALPRVLAVVQDPVFIGSVVVLLWCLLMVTAVCLYRRHTRNSGLGHRHHKSTGLYRLASEDLIIKHRMAAPDSPWISGAWRPALCGKPYQDLWAQGQESPNPSLSKSTLPITAKKDPGHLESVVPIVPDSCGVYGTFYVDLSGNNLKTFNSPARRTKMPHYHSADQNCETVIIPQPAARNKAARDGPAMPWRRALPSQPNMGVLKESWEKNCKRELHAVKSAPLVPMSQQSRAVGSITGVNKQRLSHQPPALPPPGGFPDGLKSTSSPRMLHYSASLHLVDMMPPPPRCGEDMHSLSSEEGSSRSTKLTMDVGSLQSICTPSVVRGAATSATTSVCPSYPGRTYSRLSTASFCRSAEPSLDEDLDLDDATLSTQDATQYLEIRPRMDRAGVLPDNLTPRPFSPTPTFGYICGPSEVEEVSERRGHQRGVAGRAQLRSTPSSCCSEWEGSLWNAWGSISEGNMPSARTSIISSSDCSFMNDANFARVLALTAESMTGASLSDFSPSGSPLNVLFPPPRDCFGELDPLPVWDWGTTWVDEMEAQYHAGRTGGATAAAAASLSSVPDRWGYHHRQDPRQANHKMPSHR
ncbi:roundabout homolog 1 isoform X2 [Alosa sapidissima]|uniref:roundabout homolog 1 isoform X2 n=1 Tax=Alosa sapidissima TaxID=34773 RepID=UPI001C0A4E46|nr:roundabout homolog 1 isoform X2 [Alosa sapidissima]